MQRYSGHDYSLKVSRVKRPEDEGEYIVRAENSFGRRESSAYLTVEPVRETTRGKLISLFLFPSFLFASHLHMKVWHTRAG